ncbi:serine hydrolase [Mycobacterium numidiamassiliense]|uniref:serine hydrolase domain-containing protein n=1 Tax=Mycobacterium numidiamassiliense TaxID=1841861 RepID=UPI0031839660
MFKGHGELRRRRWGALFAIVLALGGCNRPAATPASDPPANTTNSSVAADKITTLRANSQRVLDDAVKAGGPGCSAAVGSQGNVVWAGVRGLADLVTAEEITTETVFDIGSVSKQFTATAILLLAQAGKLTLGDPLSKYVSGFPGWAATVSIAQLMHQTSGIPDYVDILIDHGIQVTERATEDQALQALAAVPQLNSKPGERFAYSNSNYVLLGEIVHRVSGTPLPQFLSDNIFRPLDLAMVMDPVGQIPHKAVSYNGGSEGYHAASSAWEQVGDGAIQTTPSQLVQWADNYRTGRVGGPKLLEAQLAGAVEIGPGIPVHYGAGIYIRPDGSLDHDGAWLGFVAAFRVSKDRLTSVAVSCNTDDQVAEALAESIAKVWM